MDLQEIYLFCSKKSVSGVTHVLTVLEVAAAASAGHSHKYLREMS